MRIAVLRILARRMGGRCPAIRLFPAIGIVFVLGLPAAGTGAIARAQSAAAPPPQPAGGPNTGMVVLDRVVAVINDDVILESDLDEEVRFTDLLGDQAQSGAAERQSALDRLIDRDLILQQIKVTQVGVSGPAPEEVERQVSELRSQLPRCAQEHCETAAGWHAFLAARSLTEEEVLDRWRQRILILSFIQSRFGAGIRIAQSEIEDYYNNNFAAEFRRRNLQPPPVSAVSARIQEILLQQHVNSLLQDWLESLKQEGSVIILNADLRGTGVPSAQAEPGRGARP